jgi:zinc protease
VLYPDDARAVISPTADSIKKITRQNLIDYYKTYYRPSNSLLGVTGDVTPDTIAAKLEARLAAWESGAAIEPTLPLQGPLADKKVYLVNRPNSVQTYLVLANRAIDRMNPDYIASQVMNRVLGAGPSARLFRNIREDKGYTYGVGSSFTALKYVNHFSASSSVRTDVTGPAIEEFLKEFRDIRDNPVPRDELDTAKRAIVAGFALGLENQSGVLRQIILLREYGLPDDYWDTYPAKVMAVTAEDVQRVARKYVPVDNLQLIAVGDATKIRELLRKFGPVEEYTAEGTRITGE